jgi:hypothetical protein
MMTEKKNGIKEKKEGRKKEKDLSYDELLMLDVMVYGCPVPEGRGE